jgi:Ser/Thr protein kinase RdoA (MazF antagonist)
MNHSDTAALVALIGRYWPLDHVTVESVLQESDTRSTLLIHSDQGGFVVKVYESAMALGLVNPAPKLIDHQLSVLDVLAETGFYHAPKLLRSRSGSRFIQIDDQTISIQEQVVGTSPPDTPATWAELGRIAARLNAVTAHPHPYAIPIAGTIAELTERAAQYPFREQLLALVATLHRLEHQPRGLIHAEINCANAIQATGGRLVVVDWDQAGNGPCVLEAGYPLLTHFLTENLVFHRESARAFYHGYTEGGGMSDDERDLVFTAALLHAMRHLDFGDRDRRWRRIEYALAHRDGLLAVMSPAR